MRTSIRRNTFIVGALMAGLSLLAAGRAEAQTFTNTFTSLYSFRGGNNGAYPQTTLAISSNTLFGTTPEEDYIYDTKSDFGMYSYGTVFSLTTNGQNFTNVHVFSGLSSGGLYPYGGVIIAGNVLYGTTWEGGADGYGTVFSMNPDGTGYTILHSFTYDTDGGYPYGGLILAGNTLYGTTEYGGIYGCGTIFSIPTNGGALTNLHTFSDENTGGYYPEATLALSGNTLFGTTEYGGIHDAGTLFSITTNGAGFATLHNFGGGSDGDYPRAGLVVSASGATLYGTTEEGGTNGYGSVYAFSTNGGVMTNLHSFNYNDGGYLESGLILASNTLYGTAYEGGSNGYGTVFAVNTDGTGFTNMYNFGYDTDGGYPEAGLLLSGNMLYGTTEEGGTNGYGTVFSLAVSNIAVVVTGTVSFTATPTTGIAPLTVYFSSPSFDSQTNAIIGWSWAFGDGGTSTAQNPTYTYTNAGTNTPTLQATNINGVLVTETGPTITVSPPIPTLAFTASPTKGVIPLTVSFSSPTSDNEGNGISGWSWVFGDGATSTAQNPTHTYTVADAYYPSLTATNNNATMILASGPSISAFENTIGVSTAPTVGAVPLTVNFTSAGIDKAGFIVTNWNWVFGDGTTSTAQNPTHTYTSANTYFATLTAVNSAGSGLTGFGPPSITATNVAVYLGLVQNGGFETGDMTGWAYSGANNNAIDIFVDNGSQSLISPHSGNYLAALGPIGSLGYISQTLATSAGAPYLLSFWLDSPDGAIPNQFLVSWNGTNLYNQTNLPALGWTNMQFQVAASGTSTVLEFGAQNDNSYFGLDDVSVSSLQPGIGGLKLSGTNLVLNGVNGITNGTYYVMMSTNILLPFSQWAHVATNVLSTNWSTNGNFTITISKPVISGAGQRYYVIQYQ
jgi:uncharacterized repeat protein (TIGR03803 family)